jgi:hypothetical protein
MPQDVHGHRFLHQRRTDAAGLPNVFGEPMFESVATERFAGARHEERGLARSVALDKPEAQGADQARREWSDPLLSSFSLAAHMCAGCEMDIGTSKADQLRCAQTRLSGEAEECVVSPPGPRRAIGGGKQRADFRLGQEGHEPSVEALGRDGENARDESGMIGMTKGGVSE